MRSRFALLQGQGLRARGGERGLGELQAKACQVSLQLFCKEVPSNRVLNVKFKWQSSSNEMMLGAEN